MINFNASTSLVNAANAIAFTVEPANFRERCNAFDAATVDAMVQDIRDSFERRDSFEGANAIGANSYTNNRDKVLNNSIAVARFLLALDIKPSNVIERKVNANAMFNAKALKKIVELAKFAVLGTTKIEKVMSAFILCSLAFDARESDGDAISNKVNKSFLSGLNFTDMVKDADLADYLSDYQHKYISGGKDTQSSQARNVLDVLGLGHIRDCDNRYRGGIAINSDHEFYAQFCDVFVK